MRSTFRPEVIGDIGGFGGLFAVRPAALPRPGARVVDRRRRHQGARSPRPPAGSTRSASTSSRCASTTSSCQGAEPLFFLDYISVGKLDPDQIEELVDGRRRGLPPGRLRAARRRDGRAPRRDGARRVRPRRLRGRRRRARPAHHRRARRRRATCSSACRRPGLRSQRLLARPPGAARRGRPSPRRARPATGAHHSLADELLRPSVIYAPADRARCGGRVDVHAVAHITGGGIPGNLVRVLPDGADAVVDARHVGGAADLRRDPARSASVADDEMAQVFNLGIGMVVAVGREDADERVRRCSSGRTRRSRSSARSSRIGSAHARRPDSRPLTAAP